MKSFIFVIILLIITILYFIYNAILLYKEFEKEKSRLERKNKMKVEKSKNIIFIKIRQICQYIKRHLIQIKQILFITLLMIMIWFIYQISPKITEIIQNIAWYLSEIDGIYITRIVEIALVVSFITPFAMKKDKGGEE